MLLKSLHITGFRGFNNPVLFEFNRGLTVITGPNSHGKTSITEALELLIYGVTSKVDDADNNREEFRGTYRNIHYPADKDASIVAVFERVPDGTLTEYVVRIAPDEKLSRSIDGVEVISWPDATISNRECTPLVVQHALKNLLLKSPSDRFSQFASLLGLHEVEACQRAIGNLCTKPEAHLSPQIQDARKEWTLLSAKLGSSTLPKKLISAFMSTDHAKAYSLTESEVSSRLGSPFDDTNAVKALREVVAKARARAYSGSAGLVPLSVLEADKLQGHRETLERAAGGELLELQAAMAMDKATARLRDHHKLLGLSLVILADDPSECPVCKQEVSPSIIEAVHATHSNLSAQLGEDGRDSAATRFAQVLTRVSLAVKGALAIQSTRVRDVAPLRDADHRDVLLRLLGARSDELWPVLEEASAQASDLQLNLKLQAENVVKALEDCSAAMDNDASVAVEAASELVARYVKCHHDFDEALAALDVVLAPVTAHIQKAIDAAAGTGDLLLLTDLLVGRDRILKLLRVRDAIDGLKQLKQAADQAAGELMEDAFTEDLTGAVMSWYGKIKTSTDPDVHFSGFSMARAKTGTVRPKRVQINAESYGKPLVSAASSLSESKLNALGLSVCLATATRPGSPWSFVLIDDPIQSWDQEHEAQFIGVIEALAAAGKQVVLLSHRIPWVEEQLVPGTRSLNGSRFEITGYNVSGPAVVEKQWVRVGERLKEIVAIAKNIHADQNQLQRGEAETRIVACDLVAVVSRTMLGRPKSAHDINAAKARAILIEANYPHCDKICQIFGTADPAHHTGDGYSPDRSRLAVHHGYLTTLNEWVSKSKLRSQP